MCECCCPCSDFVNTALPWGDPDLNSISALLPTGEISNVLTINFDGAVYPVTLDSVHTASCGLRSHCIGLLRALCGLGGVLQRVHGQKYCTC